MNVLIIGNHSDAERFIARFQLKNTQIENYPPASFSGDLVVWFDPEEDPSLIQEMDFGLPIMIETTAITLTDLMGIHGPVEASIIGFCGLPTFLERDCLELSLLPQESADVLENLMDKMNIDFELVGDRLGLVSPRTIFMIINEAYFTLQEGTATKIDIDQAMKLGTNYPFGPFEWAEKIGLSKIYITLETLNKELGDPRYRPCELMKAELLLNP